MENNENFVTDQVAENVAATTEEAPKVYTEKEFNDRVNEAAGKRTARKMARYQKETDEKYGRLMALLQSGTGKQSVEEIEETLRQQLHRVNPNAAIPSKPALSEKEEAYLANMEADEIIEAGIDEITEELNRLTEKAESMTKREQVIYKKLAEKVQGDKRKGELAKLGISEKDVDDPAFVKFASQFRADVPISAIWGMYSKDSKKEAPAVMGSMKSSKGNDNGLKDYYSPEEAKRFTKEDYDRMPGLYDRVSDSMRRWKKK